MADRTNINDRCDDAGLQQRGSGDVLGGAGFDDEHGIQHVVARVADDAAGWREANE